MSKLYQVKVLALLKKLALSICVLRFNFNYFNIRNKETISFSAKSKLGSY
jgi:hypothetical protein